VHDKQSVSEEIGRISGELEKLRALAGFPERTSSTTRFATMKE